MTNLHHDDVRWCVRLLPKSVKDLLKAHRSVFLAGGYIRSRIANEAVQDIDLFVSDFDRAALVASALANGSTVHKSENAFSLEVGEYKVQVIHRWTFAHPSEAIKSFDFTIAQAAIYYSSGWQSVCAADYYRDLAGRRLVYTRPDRNEDAGGSILRVLKFYQRGYRMPLDSLSAVVARLVSGVPAVSVPQDVMADKLLGLLHEVDPAVAGGGEFYEPHSGVDDE